MGFVRRYADPRVIVGIVSGGHFLSHFYILVFPPLFPLLETEFGLNNTQLGVIMSVVAVGMLLQVPAGEVVNRVGAKRVFVLGVALTATGIILAGLAPSYRWLIAAVVVSGVGQSAFHPADYALLGAVADGDRQGKSFGIHTFGGYAGFAVAPILVGTLGIVYGWRTALLLVGAVGILYAVVAALTMEEVYLASVEESDRAADAAGRLRDSLSGLMQPRILGMAVFFITLVMAGKGTQTFTSVFLIDAFGFSESLANSTFTAFFVFVSLGVLVGGVLADRYDPRWVVVASLSTAAVVTWTIVSGVLGIGVVAAFVLFSLLGICYGLPLPSRDRLVSESSTTGSLGVNFGFVFTAASVGSFVSPAVLGAVIDVASASAAFAIIGAFFLAAAGVAFAVGGPSTLATLRSSVRS